MGGFRDGCARRGTDIFKSWETLVIDILYTEITSPPQMHPLKHTAVTMLVQFKAHCALP